MITLERKDLDRVVIRSVRWGVAWKASGTETGPQCPCGCGHRNMQRMGYSLYRCQESGDCYLFIVDARAERGYRMAPLPQLEAI